MKYLLALLTSASLFATAGQKGEPFIAIIWQEADGSYRFVDVEGKDMCDETHTYRFETPRHALDCPCFSNDF
jgi:hypothetical protein